MNRLNKNLRVQTKFDFDAIVSQIENESPLAKIYTKKFSGIKNLDLYESPNDEYVTPKESSNSLVDEFNNTKSNKDL